MIPVYKFIFITAILISSSIFHIAYADEKYEDVTASVTVNSNFKVSADSAPIDFGIVDPAKAAVELYTDRYFNEVKCTSNNGRTWYLKAHCENLTGPKAAISKTHLKIRIFWTNGNGYHSRDWASFGDMPILIYTSDYRDTMGAEVKLQFSYKLELPSGAPGGNYNALITYTLTETP